MKFIVLALWNYRGFIIGNVKREFQSKYRNSLLGAVWTIINPLSMIVVYTVIFSQIMKARLPGVDSVFAYSIYLCAGILTWSLFSEIVGRAQNVFLDNANILKKLSFPRLCLPVIVVANALLNFSIIFGLFTAFLLITNNFPGWSYFTVFPILFIQITFAIGLGLTIGVLNVFFRDVGQFFGIFLQFWFWLTPIVYPISIIPEAVRPLFEVNPMAIIIEGYQTILVNKLPPNWYGLLMVFFVSIILCLLALRLFRKSVGEMVDEL